MQSKLPHHTPDPCPLSRPMDRAHGAIAPGLVGLGHGGLGLAPLFCAICC
jgi:hypothetical protein